MKTKEEEKIDQLIKQLKTDLPKRTNLSFKFLNSTFANLIKFNDDINVDIPDEIIAQITHQIDQDILNEIYRSV